MQRGARTARGTILASSLLAATLSIGAGATAQRVDLKAGQATNLTLRSTADKINVGTPGIVELFLPDPHTLSIRGLKAGATFLVIHYEEGSIETVGVVVAAGPESPAEALATELRKNLQSVEGINVGTRGDKVVISGMTDPRNAGYYRQVTALFADRIIDEVRFAQPQRMRVAAPTTTKRLQGAASPIAPSPPEPPSVQIDVQVAEVDVSKSRDLGIQWFPAGQPWVLSGTGSINQTGILAGSASLTLSQVQWQLIALVNRGVARLLATPKLIVQSGKRATMVAGGEVPIVQTTALSSTVEYKKFGTQLDISPVVQPDHRIRITLKAALSSLDFVNRVQGYPTINSREAETDLIIDDGRTFAVAGLLRREEHRTHSGLPALGDIPGAGLLFGRDTTTYDDIETLIFVTPHVLGIGGVSPIIPGTAIDEMRSTMQAPARANEVPRRGDVPAPSPTPGAQSRGGHWWEQG